MTFAYLLGLVRTLITSTICENLLHGHTISVEDESRLDYADTTEHGYLITKCNKCKNTICAWNSKEFPDLYQTALYFVSNARLI